MAANCNKNMAALQHDLVKKNQYTWIDGEGEVVGEAKTDHALQYNSLSLGITVSVVGQTTAMPRFPQWGCKDYGEIYIYIKLSAVCVALW